MIKLTHRRVPVRADCINYREYLTDVLIEKYDKMFREEDESGEGSLSKENVEVLFQKLGYQLTSNQIGLIFDEVDKDESGFIEYDEFCAMMVKLTGVRKRINPLEYVDKADIDRFRRVFAACDDKNDGLIDSKELDGLLRRLGVVLSHDQVEQMLIKYDADGSGEIDFQEFSAMMVDLKNLRRARRITPENCDCKDLKSKGFTADEVKLAGFEAKHLREAKYTAKECVAANFRPLQLRHAGYSANELLGAGIGVCELKRIGYSASDLRQAGTSTSALRAVAT